MKEKTIPVLIKFWKKIIVYKKMDCLIENLRRIIKRFYLYIFLFGKEHKFCEIIAG
jgi:hypothetical protein